MVGLAGRRALVVDDELLVQMVMSHALEDEGASVLPACDGAEALKLLEQGSSIDVLVTDVTMPVLDGWSLAERARAARPDLPVVYVTGMSFAPSRQVAGSLLVPKPFRSEDLVDAVSRVLQREAA